jgi:hypothetical protein
LKVVKLIEGNAAERGVQAFLERFQLDMDRAMPHLAAALPFAQAAVERDPARVGGL